MVRSKSATTLKLCCAVIFVFSVPTVFTTEYRNAKQGDNVILSCNEKKPLNWLNKENEIIGRQKGRIPQNVDGNLMFKSARFSDSGIYTCSNVDGSVSYKSIQLEISGAPNLINVTSVVDVENDKDAVVNCEAEGHPDPVITWFVYKSGQKQKIADGSKLNTRISCKYCQMYFLCQAVNKFGEQSANITFNVVGKPEVNILEKSMSGIIGKNVTVHCVIKSNPPVVYMQWLKNGKLVQQTNRKNIGFKVKNGNEMHVSLSIKKLKKNDFDEYECLGVNAYGNATKRIQITLNSKKSSRKSKEKPRISPLSASTELVISTGEKQKVNSPKSNNLDNKTSKEEADTQSAAESASTNMGSICKNSRKEFTAIILLSFVMSMPIFLS